MLPYACVQLLLISFLPTNMHVCMMFQTQRLTIQNTKHNSNYEVPMCKVRNADSELSTGCPCPLIITPFMVYA